MLDLGIVDVKRTVRYVRLEFADRATFNTTGLELSWRIYLAPNSGMISHDVRLNPWLVRDAGWNRSAAQRYRDRGAEKMTWHEETRRIDREAARNGRYSS